MIQLFNINNHIVDTSNFSNLLHDSAVIEFEEMIADYVGAKFLMRNFSAVKNAIYKNPDQITVDQYTESMSRMAVGWTAMWYMSDNEMGYIKQGLSWKKFKRIKSSKSFTIKRFL